ncbi:hypothetical protein SUGI_0994830 [Cryptomeria japonica]|nr:hypothetical protein SUGI_0994830 [Cryptomeria japonica]
MTCYEILMGKQPFLGVNPKDLYQMIVRGTRPILQQSSCPAVLADFIAICWEIDPGRRPCFAQVSTFMRNMKFSILRWSDPRDWLAISEGKFYPTEPEVYVQLETSNEEAFDESFAEEKLKSITRVLHIIPSDLKLSIISPSLNRQSPITSNWKPSSSTYILMMPKDSLLINFSIKHENALFFQEGS